MAVICEFGTAPEQARDGYKIVGLVYGTDEDLLAEYSSLDVRFVRGAAVHGQPGVWEFAAMHPPKSVQVKHWQAYGEGEAKPATHQIDIEDQRGVNGQVYLTVGAMDGALDDMISVVAEVNTNPVTGTDEVPCVHVSFDDDAMAFSLFKVGDKILLRLENDVTLTRTESPTGPMFVVG